MKYNISQHAKQRYSERLRNKNELIEINSFIIQNEEKIKTDINEMIERGELIFKGISFQETKNNKIQIYLKDNWVIIVDPEKLTVITLYAIDLGLGSEFNKSYISQMMERINEEKEKIKNAMETIAVQKRTYQELIDENLSIINQYSSIVKSLKEQNADYQKLIDDLEDNKIMAEVTLRELLGKLVGKKSV